MFDIQAFYDDVTAIAALEHVSGVTQALYDAWETARVPSEEVVAGLGSFNNALIETSLRLRKPLNAWLGIDWGNPLDINNGQFIKGLDQVDLDQFAGWVKPRYDCYTSADMLDDVYYPLEFLTFYADSTDVPVDKLILTVNEDEILMELYTQILENK